MQTIMCHVRGGRWLEDICVYAAFLYQQTHGSNPPARLCLPFLPSFCFLHRTKRSLAPSSSSSSTRPLLHISPSLHRSACPANILHPPLFCWCPHLTLLGLDPCQCPFGSGTAGAAAEGWAPLPPLCCLTDIFIALLRSFSRSQCIRCTYFCVTPHNDPILSRVSYLIGSAIPEEMWRIKRKHSESEINTNVSAIAKKDNTKTRSGEGAFALLSLQSVVMGR